MKTKTTRSKPTLLGMTYLQIGILSLLGICAILLLGSFLFYIIYSTAIDTLPVSQPATLPPAKPATSTPVPPAPTSIPPTRTPVPTYTPRPTHTPLPTATITATITQTPTLWFQDTGNQYIPKTNELPSGFKTDTAGSGSSQGEHYVTTTVVYTNDYPNYHQTEDPYMLIYEFWIYDSDARATAGYNGVNQPWIEKNWKNWFNFSQDISVSQADFNVGNVDASAAFWGQYQGPSVPGFFVFVKIKSHNAVFTIKTLSHGPSGDIQRAISNANYYASLLTQKLK